MDTSCDLTEFLLAEGAALAGFADLSGLPESPRTGFPFGVVIALPIDPAMVTDIAIGNNARYYAEYTRLNERLNALAVIAAAWLVNHGFRSFARTQENTEIDQRVKRTGLPHKTIATLAGIGWIGKCALLVNERYGTAFRITSVLTDAPLETGTPVTRSMCGGCTGCVDACPARAVSGKNWEPSMDRDEFFDAMKCRDAISERGKAFGIPEGGCSLCIPACPWTKRYLAACGIA